MTWQVFLKGESAALKWQNGKICAQGYDLESEKMAMILSGGYGEGIGALLVAVDICCQPNQDLSKELHIFEKSVKAMKLSAEEWMSHRVYQHEVAANFLAAMYLVFSSDDVIRLITVNKAKFNKRGFDFLLQSNDPYIFIELARREDLPVRYFETIASHRDFLVKVYLAKNKALPISILEILGNDEDENVRFEVARHQKCSPAILEKLAFDEKEKVQAVVCLRSDLSHNLQVRIIEKGNLSQKTSLAKMTQDREIISILKSSSEPRIKASLKWNRTGVLSSNEELRTSL